MAISHTRSVSRKKVSVVLMAIAALALLAGCSPSGAGSPVSTTGSAALPADSDSKDFTIYWNAGHAYDIYQKVIDDFDAAHGLTINWQKYQWPDLNAKLAADFQGGTAPDLVEVGSGAVAADHGVNGHAMNLNQLLASDNTINFPADYQAAAVDAVTFNGATYSIPLHMTANGILYYNKTLLANAGFTEPPKTWDEMLTIARAVTQGDTYGFALNSDATYVDPWLLQAGVTRSDASKGQFMVPEESATATMQFLQDLVFKYKVSPIPVASSDYAGPQKLFSAGKAAMFVSGPWDVLPVKQAGGVDWGIAPPLKNKVQASSLAGSVLMIPEKSPHPQLAWQLMAKLTALDVELAATAQAGISMPRKSWASSAAVTSDPNLSVIAQAVAVAQPPDSSLAATGASAAVASLWSTAYQSAIIQNKPVADALATYRTQAQAAIK